MNLAGSCHCGAVKFHFESLARYPYLRCYCKLCRKTAGGGGYAVNIKGLADSLQISGKENVTEYTVPSDDIAKTDHAGDCAKRFFCKNCGSSLWANNSAWLQWIFPFASAIDTPLPVPPENVHIMLKYSAEWCAPKKEDPLAFAEYPNEGLEDWHERLGLE